MAGIVAGVLCVLVALCCAVLFLLDIHANAEARVTGGDAGGLSFWPPLLFLAFGGLGIWLFIS